jgi:hypothetical protein
MFLVWCFGNVDFDIESFGMVNIGLDFEKNESK